MYRSGGPPLWISTIQNPNSPRGLRFIMLPSLSGISTTWLSYLMDSRRMEEAAMYWKSVLLDDRFSVGGWRLLSRVSRHTLLRMTSTISRTISVDTLLPFLHIFEESRPVRGDNPSGDWRFLIILEGRDLSEIFEKSLRVVQYPHSKMAHWRYKYFRIWWFFVSFILDQLILTWCRILISIKTSAEDTEK